MSSLYKQNLTKRHKMTSRKFLFAVLGIAVVAGAAGVLPWAPAAGPESLEESGRAVTAAVARFQKSSEFSLPRIYTGLVKSRQNSDLGFKRTGRLEEILVDQGDVVQAGQVLAGLDTAILRASIQEAEANLAAANAKLQELNAGPRTEQIEAAKARLEEAEAQVRLSQSQYDRRKQLKQSGAISDQEIDDSQFQLEAAKGRAKAATEEWNELVAGTRQEQLAAQQAVVRQWESTALRLGVELEESQLVAPFAGVVSRRFLDEGTVVSPGANVVSLVDQQSLEVWLGLPINEAGSLQKDAQYVFDVSGLDVSATFKTLLPELDQRTRTVTAVFTLSADQQNQPLPIGALAKLKLDRQVEQNGYWIETTALVRGQRGLWSVYVVQPDGQQISAAGLESNDEVRAKSDVEIPSDILTTDSESDAQASQSYQTGTLQKVDVELLEVDTQRVLIRGPILPDGLYIRDGAHKFTSGQLIRYQTN